MRSLGTRASALAALAMAISAISTSPAMAQEWRVTPEPREMQGAITCALTLNHPDYAVLIVLAGDTPNLIIRSRYLVGVAHGTRSIVLRFPTGFMSRVTLNKNNTDSNIAMVEIHSDSDLYAMIDGFAVSGDFTVTVLGGRPTAFRLRQLPAAAHAIPTMKDCIEDLYYG